MIFPQSQPFSSSGHDANLEACRSCHKRTESDDLCSICVPSFLVCVRAEKPKIQLLAFSLPNMPSVLSSWFWASALQHAASFLSRRKEVHVDSDELLQMQAMKGRQTSTCSQERWGGSSGPFGRGLVKQFSDQTGCFLTTWEVKGRVWPRPKWFAIFFETT